METDDRAMDEVYNITDTLPGHNHSGQASYIMYANNRCRHSECLKQFNEYRERLYARKLTGQFVDMRVTANRDEAVLKAALERIANDPELAGKLIPVMAGTVESSSYAEPGPDALEPESEAVTDAATATDTPQPVAAITAPLSDDARELLDYLSENRGHAVIHALGVAALVKRWTSDRVKAGMRELIDAGKLLQDGASLVMADEVAA